MVKNTEIMFYKLIYLFGQYIRNPSLKKHLQFLKKTENWSGQELKKYQLAQIINLIEFSYKYSSFYRQVMIDLKITPEDIKSFEDLKKLPIITKKDLIVQNDLIHTNFQFKKKFKAVTSGSTGESLEFYREESADSFNRASIAFGYSKFNVNPWDKNGYFWGFNFSFSKKIKTIILDNLQNRFRIFSYKNSEINRFVKKLKNATYIHGYSSMIYQTAKIINEKGLPKPKKLKMIKGTSEKIFDSYQSEVKKAFGLKIISEYGAAESGIIAFECTEGNMHINMEGVFVEEINNEIIVTNLVMKSFPIIRYKLGDYIKLAPKEFVCKCGKKHQVITEVLGRVGSNVYGKNQMYPSLSFYYIFKNLSKKNNLVLNYQVIQEKKGKLLFKIEQKLSKENTQLLNNEIFKYFKDDIDFIIEDETVLLSTKKKLKNFISLVNE